MADFNEFKCDNMIGIITDVTRATALAHGFRPTDMVNQVLNLDNVRKVALGETNEPKPAPEPEPKKKPERKPAAGAKKKNKDNKEEGKPDLLKALKDATKAGALFPRMPELESDDMCEGLEKRFGLYTRCLTKPKSGNTFCSACEKKAGSKNFFTVHSDNVPRLNYFDVLEKRAVSLDDVKQAAVAHGFSAEFERALAHETCPPKGEAKGEGKSGAKDEGKDKPKGKDKGAKAKPIEAEPVFRADTLRDDGVAELKTSGMDPDELEGEEDEYEDIDEHESDCGSEGEWDEEDEYLE